MKTTSNDPVRVCFLGTPPFAAEHLKSLLQNSRYQVVGVVTQPDRPAGRKMQLTPSAVKVMAVENGLPVLTPENLRKEPEINEQIKNWKADLAVVVAFGQILSQDFLDQFKFGAVNVHGSLLPKWRGAAPIQRSLEAGDAVTGISLQKVVKKLDAGDLIGERKIVVDDQINAIEMYDRMAILGCEMLGRELLDYVDGRITLQPQDESQVTYAHKIEKEESHLDATWSARRLHNKVRGFTMGPGTYFLLNDKRIKIHKSVVKKVAVHFVKDVLNKSLTSVGDLNPAVVVKSDEDQMWLLTGDRELREQILNSKVSEVEVLEILEIQPESKPKMKIQDFLKSTPLKKGDIFK